MSKYFLFPLIALSLGGCSLVPDNLFDGFGKQSKAPVVQTEAAPEITPEAEIPDNARTVEDFDITSESDRRAALKAAQNQRGETDLGLTIASLGDATSPGIWLKTPLVREPGQGRVLYPEKGTSVAVELIPLDAEPGSGSRISLAAMRLLEADLTGLPEIRVFRSR